METVEVVVKLPKEYFEFLQENKDRFRGSRIYDCILDGTVLHERHGKIVDLGKIDEDKIEQDNPIITIDINGTTIEAVSLDYLDNLPDLTKKEDKE